MSKCLESSVREFVTFLKDQGCSIRGAGGSKVQITTPSGLEGEITRLGDGSYEEVLRDGEKVIKRKYTHFAELKVAWMDGCEEVEACAKKEVEEAAALVEAVEKAEENQETDDCYELVDQLMQKHGAQRTLQQLGLYCMSAESAGNGRPVGQALLALSEIDW